MPWHGEIAEDQVGAVHRGEKDERPVKESKKEECSNDAADQEAEPCAGVSDAGASSSGAASTIAI